jgi:hypothetical protein
VAGGGFVMAAKKPAAKKTAAKKPAAKKAAGRKKWKNLSFFFFKFPEFYNEHPFFEDTLKKNEKFLQCADRDSNPGLGVGNA